MAKPLLMNRPEPVFDSWPAIRAKLFALPAIETHDHYPQPMINVCMPLSNR